jgi:hypothetical protein
VEIVERVGWAQAVLFDGLDTTAAVWLALVFAQLRHLGTGIWCWTYRSGIRGRRAGSGCSRVRGNDRVAADGEFTLTRATPVIEQRGCWVGWSLGTASRKLCRSREPDTSPDGPGAGTGDHGFETTPVAALGVAVSRTSRKFR